ncbi:hypothetical protein P5673_019312, partial [Acropora cervicornis]
KVFKGLVQTNKFSLLQSLHQDQRDSELNEKIFTLQRHFPSVELTFRQNLQ